MKKELLSAKEAFYEDVEISCENCLFLKALYDGPFPSGGRGEAVSWWIEQAGVVCTRLPAFSTEAGTGVSGGFPYINLRFLGCGDGVFRRKKISLPKRYRAEPPE